MSVNAFNEGNELKSRNDELINPKIHWFSSFTYLAYFMGPCALKHVHSMTISEVPNIPIVMDQSELNYDKSKG